jgi:hypothetical protein
MRRRLLFLSLLLSAGLSLRPATITWAQQCSAWFSLNDDSPSTPRLGLRWQPSLFLDAALGGPWKLDSELSLDAAGSLAAPGWRDPEFTGDIRTYRLWLRLSSARFEARLGLQKINFGSAMLFRPLMWFDRIDPRDPLQITDGVTGLLLRYYFKGNANLWLWGLFGNRDAKGWETRPTARGAPEFGGRFQAPLPRGEAGVSLHFRRPDPGVDAPWTESRLALDGKWDLAVGLWVEAAVSRQRDPASPFLWQRMLTLGVDYTFTLGNGLYLLAEHFLSGGSRSLLGSAGNGAALSALLARYPLGVIDALSAVFYFDWRHGQVYNFASWQRTYDRWQFNLMLFWNPRQALIAPGAAAQPGNATFSGRGFELLAAWNI